MKSKATFDLDLFNNPVILVNLEHSEDVRDKIAIRFREGFHQCSNLAVVRFLPGNSGTGNELEISPLSGVYERAAEQLWPVPTEQLSSLIRNCSVRLAQNSIGIDWEYLKKEYEQIREEYEKKTLPPEPNK